MHNAVLTLAENTKGRDFVVGDIHGTFDLLDEALLAVNFNPANDRLIAIGDLVDRGDRSADCVHYLNQPWFYSVRGNHEQLFLRLYKDRELDIDGVARNIKNGAAWIITTPVKTLDLIYDAFQKLPLAIEIKTAHGLMGFVHANVPADMPWQDFKKKLNDENDIEIKKFAMIDRTRLYSDDNSGVAGLTRIFFGHSTIQSGPKMLGNCFYIDTGAVFEGKGCYMTLIDIKANANDICTPNPTKNDLIRTVTIGRSTPKI